MKIETLAIHTANHPDPVTGSIAPSINLSTTFARDKTGELVGDFSYSRAGNPNRVALEAASAMLEDGAAAFAYSSGVAAIFSVLHTLAPGDHVLAPSDVYHGTHALLMDKAERGLEVDFVDMDEIDQVAGVLKANTRLVLVETPSNPMLRISDIQAIVSLAATVGAKVAVDNTWATPVLQHPISLGADYSIHSTTKYFGGHSDVLGGMVVCKEDNESTQKMRDQQWIVGAVPSPFDCWLIRRGLMTMPVRVRTQSKTAARIAAFLDSHSQVKRVHYPGLLSHPNHEVAAAQMEEFGAMLSFQVKGGEEAASKVAENVRLFTVATSLGAVESLIEHRYRVEGEHSKTPVDLLRVSVGLEHVDDLLEDLDGALKKAAS
jgi:cystathionine gamma-synthase